MQNIMILGASDLQIPLIRQANDSGYNTVVVAPNKGEPGFKYASYSIFADVRDEDRILKVAKKYKIAGVVTDQTDIAVRTQAFIAEKLGLPGIDYRTACLFTDKYLMREKCKELGIKTLRYKKVKNLKDALRFYDRINSSVILKPIDNQGSKGVYKITDKKALIENFNESQSFSTTGEVLVEEYVNGKEFVIDGLAVNYEFQNLVWGDPHYFDLPNVFSSALIKFPSTADTELIDRVKELNKKIITGFGLKQGRTHSEFIINEDNIYLIETAARGGGVFISSEIVSLLTGLNNEELLINMATGRLRKDVIPQDKNITCCYIAFYLPVGEIISIDGISQVKNMPYTHSNNLNNLYTGMKTKPYTDKTSRYFIIISAPTHEKLKQNINKVRAELKIKVKSDDGIVRTPIWK